MIQDLSIFNFKSIKSLKLNCKKINVFIGEPNAGKSNIVEALSILSSSREGLRNMVRFKDLTDLFFDNQTSLPIKILTGSNDIEITFNNRTNMFDFSISRNKVHHKTIGVDINGHFTIPFETPIRLYKYRQDTISNNPIPGKLSVPYGDNLISILISNSSFKKLISDLFRSKGFRLNVKPVERELLISKEKDDEIYSYPFSNISETLRRIVFLMACLETNENSTIIFDEPEAHTFPFYTKYFAERIALDESNQYFFTTHNPYLLEAIVAKTPPEQLNVVIAYMESYETKLHLLTEVEVKELMSMDIFFNLKRFISAE